MFLEKRPSTRSMDVLRIRTTAQGVANYNLLFGVSPAGSGTFREDVFLPDGGCGCPRKEANPPTFPDARWVRVTVEVSFATAAASVAYDGQVIAAGMFGGITPTSSVFVAVGSLAYDPQPSVILFDDFSCTLSP